MADRIFQRLARIACFGLVGAALPLGGCSSDPRYYALAPVPGVEQPGAPVSVEVRTPVIAQWLDHDDIVRQSRDYRVHLASGDAWSGPLADQIAQTVALELAQRLPGSTVVAQNDAASTTPGAFVELTITNFNEDQDGRAVLRGALSVHSSRATIGPVMTVPLLLAAAPHAHGTASLVATLSALLGQVADQAAAQLRALPPAPPAKP